MAEFTEKVGRRITGLREREDMTMEELAAKIGVNATTLGRIEKEQTQKISSDVLVALAREFHVSADFLLGLTDIPSRKNYEINELGLSAQAVRNLYTRKVNADVLNRLLEHPHFAVLTTMIAQYLDDTFAPGVVVQNQIFSSMSEILLGIGQGDPGREKAAREAARAVSLSKTPPHQMELTKIQNMFMTMLKEMKREAGSELEPAKAVTKEAVGKIMAELSKGQDMPLTSISPEQITDAIVHAAEDGALAPEKLAEFRRGVLTLFEELPRSNDTSTQ